MPTGNNIDIENVSGFFVYKELGPCLPFHVSYHQAKISFRSNVLLIPALS